MSRDDVKRAKLRRMLQGLVRMYGETKPLKTGRGAGLDTLVEAMLAQNTNMANAPTGYRVRRRGFARWTRVRNAAARAGRRATATGGRPRRRPRRLQALLRTIKEQRG